MAGTPMKISVEVMECSSSAPAGLLKGLDQVWETPLMRQQDRDHPGGCPPAPQQHGCSPGLAHEGPPCCTAAQQHWWGSLQSSPCGFWGWTLDAGSRNLCSAQSSAGWALHSPPLRASADSQRSVSVSDVSREEMTGGKLVVTEKGCPGMHLEATCRRLGYMVLHRLLCHYCRSVGSWMAMRPSCLVANNWWHCRWCQRSSSKSWSICTYQTMERFSSCRGGTLACSQPTAGCMDRQHCPSCPGMQDSSCPVPWSCSVMQCDSGSCEMLEAVACCSSGCHIRKGRNVAIIICPGEGWKCPGPSRNKPSQLCKVTFSSSSPMLLGALLGASAA